MALSAETVYLGLGSNLGDRETNLVEAVRRLGRLAAVERLSSVYETEPVGYQEQPPFLNAACSVITSFGPFQLLVLLKGLEKDMGRMPSFPGGPRLIDVDILLYGDRVISTPRLSVPHPRMADRAFVLAPLAEIAPGLVHPVLGLTIKELLDKAPGKEGVRRLGPFPIFEREEG